MDRVLRKSCLIALCAVLLLSLGSCGSSSGVALGDLIVSNDAFSFFDITGVMALAGPEPLTAGVFIVPGDSYTFFGVLPGFYDIRITWSDASSDVFFDVFVPQGGPGFVTGFN